MIQKKEEENFIKNMEKNIYCNLKRKILSIEIRCEYNMITNFLKDIRTIKTFFLRELHGIVGGFTENNCFQFNPKIEFVLFFPKHKGDLLHLKDFMINTENINNIYANNYVYKGSLLYKEEWENYRKTLFRFKLKNNDKQKNKNEQKYSKDELNKKK